MKQYFLSIVILLNIALGNPVLASLQTDHRNQLTPVSLQLIWKHQFEFAGFYAAIEKGYYKDKGIELELREYQNGTDILHEVLDEKSTFAIGNNDIIKHRLEGKPISLLSNYFKKIPLVVITQAGIHSLHELKNKKLMISNKDLKSPLFQAALKEEGLIPGTNLTIIPHSFNSHAFINNEVDAMTAFISNEPYELEQQNKAFQIIELNGYMPGVGDNYLFTSEQLTKNSPELVRNFIEASNAGWQYALENPDEIISLIVDKYSKQKSFQALKYEAEKIRKLMQPSAHKIGSVLPQRIRLVASSLYNMGYVEDLSDLDGLIFDEEKTNKTFLSNTEKIYLQSRIFKRGIALDRQPLGLQDNEGNVIGISEDFWTLIVQKLGIRQTTVRKQSSRNIIAEIEKGNQDIFVTSNEMENKKSNAVFSIAYEQFPIAIATNKAIGFISTPSVLNGKSVAVGQSFSSYQSLKQRYPAINFFQVKDSKTALLQVSKGEVFAAIDILPVLEYHIENTAIENVKISGVTDIRIPLQIMVHKKHQALVPIINKAIDAISDEERRKIHQKWGMREVITKTDYTYIVWVIIILFIIVIVILYWNRSLAKEIRKRKLAEQKIKESEEKLRSLYELSPLGIALTDMSGNYLEFNSAFKKICGYTEAELKALDYWQLTPEEYSDKEAQQLELLKTTGQYGPYQKEYIHKDGRRIPLRLNGVLVSGQNNKPYIWSLVEDITAQLAYQNELHDAKNKAEAANYEKSLFLANMSHEIRTPLNGIIGVSQLLSDTELNNEQLELVDTLSISARHLMNIISDILDFSKIESKMVELENAPFNLQTIIEDIIKILQPLADKKKTALHFINHEINWDLIGDSSRLSQVITNIVSNAIKFIDQGEVRIESIFHQLKGDTVDFSIIVRDNGIGMSEQQQKIIFNKFSQADISTSRKYGGTGLGLSISQELVRLMGGNIEVQSQLNKGSIFTIRLSLKKDNQLPVSDPQKLSGNLNKRFQVLLVEDDKVNQMVARKIMEKLNCDLIIANNGQQALEILSDHSFDFIFMDIQMPVMDGITATEKIRETDSTSVIIAMTANVTPQDREKCFQVGMNDFITKPVKMDELTKILNKNYQTEEIE